jgi:hypothetical protein
MKSLLAGLLLAVFTTSAANAQVSPWKNYRLVWLQDFRAMTSWTQIGVSANVIGRGNWIAHTPTHKDWFTFQDPTADGHPFSIHRDRRGLTIRVQKDGNDPNNWFGGFSGGLLSSMDDTGAGFAQQYGYFEVSMQTPPGPNTWPGFWLLDRDSTLNLSPTGAEIDVMESYGNWGTGPNQTPRGDPNNYAETWHLWGPGSAHVSDYAYQTKPGMTTGFHTYGVEIEPDTITWYFDRQVVWSAPSYPEARRPFYVMVDLALGGGNYNNATGDGYNWSFTTNPSDHFVHYVAVWASPNSPNFLKPKKS